MEHIFGFPNSNMDLGRAIVGGNWKFFYIYVYYSSNSKVSYVLKASLLEKEISHFPPPALVISF